VSYTSTYPPLFSSTLTYANKYDLDEIDVFTEGNSLNPMYFDVQGLSRTFAFGKHYFTISLLNPFNQRHRLKPNSRILFEFKSSNNVVLKSDVVNFNEKNGLITCFFEVLRDPKRTYKEVGDGLGTFIIAANLQDKPEGSPGRPTAEEFSIPERFKNAINYRCVYPINIRKNATNADSPIVTNTEHRITTLTGKFSFADDVIPSTSNDPNSGADYDSSGNISTNQFASSRPSSS